MFRLETHCHTAEVSRCGKVPAAQLVKDVQENPRLTRMLGSDAAMFNAILGPCDYMDVMAPDWKSAQMNIVMKDKEVNVLQLIVRGLENL